MNLDGVVNRDAHHARRDCDAYIEEQDIDYIVEAAGQFLLTPCGLVPDEDLDEVMRFDGFSPVIVATLRPRADE